MQCHGIESESVNQRDQRARLIGDREVGPVEGIAVVERNRTVRIFFANMIEDRFDARKTTHGLADEIAVMCSPEFCVRLCIAVQIVELENGNRGHGPSFLKSCRSPIKPEICSAIRCCTFRSEGLREGKEGDRTCRYRWFT